MNELLDWAECADEYDACRRRIAELVSTLGDDDAERVVPACPDWTVHDACAHLAAIPASILAGDLPGADADAWVARTIADRAGHDVEQIMAEWASVTPPFKELMVSGGGQMAGMVLDAVAHEHDIRHAVGRPGGRDSRGVALTLGFTKLIMDRDLRTSGSGDVVRFACDAGVWQAGGPADAEPTITLDLSGAPDGSFELMRALGSRRSAAQLDALDWVGDWRSAQAGIFHMPLPETDIVE
ncbi:maleylpyruvate isomerase family mycothiol-dependent enzyme [Ilumatobacter coccineus]|uniref:Mycothiol-dependent maleylpyruvate isomerase metal-binding domain-containing protein n=1 Tax=Ilumatobacter coccineus (strain NBRC 103263 / KCTC 29153 / YM16-304) TaxID=1313172 RepID=A0A6C7E7Q5_ILUCY|nr:maleylpyruvate isomerase family mycothiol-dependent enzyme [Ilumatobacter coccineus]BAN02767.1 hypothetical protein YM304_24530 [Ilumatobacter coccineus YM16-304]